MTLLDWLRKLGIVRFGQESAVYRNAAERPLSLQQDDIFNSEKDVLVAHQQSEPKPSPQK
ncbi:MAG: hypothetical protein H6822_23155 [Planctomycetaceae bacterium]|nr:hypothetical protein [Planctomycetales bacterium]MCB9925096.1 hypothetical protein [Planctomycetaceae bacterium]